MIYNIEESETQNENDPSIEYINQIIDNKLKNYSISSSSFEIKWKNNSIFQLTTTNNELNRLLGNITNENGVSIIDLGICEFLLKNFYEINENISLIIKKHEN